MRAQESELRIRIVYARCGRSSTLLGYVAKVVGGLQMIWWREYLYREVDDSITSMADAEIFGRILQS